MDQPDFQTHLKHEAELIGSLRENLWHEVHDRVQNHKVELAAEVVVAGVMGAAFAAATKNPEMFGTALAPLVKEGAPLVAKLGLAITGADWAARFGAPMYDVWKNPEHLDSAKQNLAQNVGGGLVDYAALGIGGIAGGAGAMKFLGGRSTLGTAALDSGISSTLGQPQKSVSLAVAGGSTLGRAFGDLSSKDRRIDPLEQLVALKYE